MLSKLLSEVNQAPQFGALPYSFLASLLFIVLHKCYVPEETQFPKIPCSFLPLNLCTCCAPYLKHLCWPRDSLWPFGTQLCVSSPQLTSDASFSGLIPTSLVAFTVLHANYSSLRHVFLPPGCALHESRD